jgi:Zn-dependent M28 family amino/carboxypeptidase
VKRLLLTWALLGCAADDSSMMQVDPDAAMGSGSATVDAPPGSCTQPSVDQPWLATQLSSVTMGLAGSARATMTQRNTARNTLQTQLSALGLTPSLQAYQTGANVVARLAATTTTTKRIILGAHFDTVNNSPGANDNASGTAVVLAVARYVKEMPCRQYNLDIVLFDEEEVGLVGARAYAQTLTVADVIAVHTVDQVAWDSDNDKRFELEAPTAALEAEYKAAAIVVGVPVTKTTTEGTDHEAFRDRGMPAIGLTEEYVGGDTSPYRHLTTDTYQTVNATYQQLATKLVAQVIMTALTP